MDEDLDLINRTEAGEREAFDDLVRKYQKQLYAMLYRMVGNHEDASDLLQKAFVKAFTGLRTFERRATFKTWLYQIAINLAKNVYRDRARIEQVPIDDVIIRRNPRVLETMIANENRRMLRQSLARLPEKQRMTLMLRVQDEKKFEEIAGIMKCSVGTAKANFHHAVRKLKVVMKAKEPGEAPGPDPENENELR
ncbi:MAG: sigma-70 family RNA polymerase sigma factor [Nitrospiraceae bacterium]|nr:sigma-70 family RNA polymerase sigma factor [Nitrospiraceae bacterium]